MINQADDPVAWALMLYELEETQEHLQKLTEQMHSSGHIDNEEFRVQISHIYGHMNRIWHRKNDANNNIEDSQWDAYSKFPTDVNPI